MRRVAEKANNSIPIRAVTEHIEGSVAKPRRAVPKAKRTFRFVW
jgi:hypothetical protein